MKWETKNQQKKASLFSEIDTSATVCPNCRSESAEAARKVLASISRPPLEPSLEAFSILIVAFKKTLMSNRIMRILTFASRTI